MKRANTCGNTPKAMTLPNGAPVARTASTCFSEISSIASAKSLPMNPIEAMVSARIPASAPKPTALTNRIATITGWNERQPTMRRRAGQLIHAGMRFRAATQRIGSDSTMPRVEASTAISRLSFSSLIKSSQRPKLGGNRRARKCDAIRGYVELCAGVDDIRRERDPGHALPWARSERGRSARHRGQRVIAASPRLRRWS